MVKFTVENRHMGRYGAYDHSGCLVKDKTGNEWCTSDQTADITDGAIFTLVIDAKDASGRRRIRKYVLEYNPSKTYVMGDLGGYVVTIE